MVSYANANYGKKNPSGYIVAVKIWIASRSRVAGLPIVAPSVILFWFRHAIGMDVARAVLDGHEPPWASETKLGSVGFQIYERVALLRFELLDFNYASVNDDISG
jgi:hypothetical protein